MKKRILWILTGGTFSCVGTDRGLMPRSGDEQAEKMLSLMPDIIENYDIMPLVLMNIDSSDMTVSHHRMIADAIDANIDKYDGIVMTHGTDTMAYTAAALSVMLRNPPIPIVLTGSQRPFFDENSDAPKTGTFWDDIRYFTREEFRCQCGGKYCNGFPAEPAEETVRMADEIRRRAGVPLNVNSGVRCKRHNAEVGGVSNSLHTTGQAVDLSGAISPEKLYAIAQEVQAEKIPGRGGLGLYSWGIHEDNGKYSRWNG